MANPKLSMTKTDIMTDAAGDAATAEVDGLRMKKEDAPSAEEVDRSVAASFARVIAERAP